MNIEAKTFLKVAVLLVLTTISGALYAANMNLRQMLLSPSRYDPFIRPVNNSADPVLVDLSINYNEVDIQENKQTMTMTIWMVNRWKDELLIWNASEYAGVDKIDIKPAGIWKPAFSIHRSVDDSEIKINEDTLLNVESDGSVKLQTGFNTKTQCSMDIAKFPFEVQNCDFFIIGTYMLETEMKFETCRVASQFKIGGQWQVTNSSAEIGSKYSKSIVTLSFTIARISKFYVITIVIPLVATALLNPMVLLIPPSSGELVSVAITILLSYTVFLNMLSRVLPETSTSIAVLSVYITILQALSAVYTLICILLVKMDTLKSSNQTFLGWLLKKYGKVGTDINKKDLCGKDNNSMSDNEHPNRLVFFVCFTVSLSITIVTFAYISS